MGAARNFDDSLAASKCFWYHDDPCISLSLYEQASREVRRSATGVRWSVMVAKPGEAEGGKDIVR